MNDPFLEMLQAAMREASKSGGTSDGNFNTAAKAKAAKNTYDAYMEVGFNEQQAFELLKINLTGRR